jgi:DNA-binding transcriptional LysR family regulator
MDVHLRDLRYFVAVAEELSFSRAAERLFVSQPTLSKQVRALERVLRTTLFERNGRSLALTVTGAELLTQARRMLSEWDDATGELQRMAGRQRATVVVGIHTGIARGLVASAAALLERNRPESSIQFRQAGWEDATAGLADGDVDAALVWLPIPDERRFAAKVLIAEPRVVLLPRGHRLAASKQIELRELSDEPFLALPSAAGPLRDFWLGIDAGLAPRVAGEVRSADEAFEAVAAGTGVALASEGNARHYAHDGVVARPVAELAPALLAVAWRGDDSRPLVADFVAACSQAAATAPTAPPRRPDGG